MTATPTPVMNREKIRALSNDNPEAQLLRPEGRPKPETRPQVELRPQPKANRNRWRSRVAARLVYLLEGWWEKQPEPRGLILCGEAEIRPHEDAEALAGIDVAYVAADVAGKTPDDVPWVHGPPALAVVILSHTDQLQDIWSKVHDLLEAGGSLVWVVDLFFRTVCVHRPEAEPKLFNVQQELTGDTLLPGFKASVADIFKT
jgi:Uma2 family endonuclease